MPKKLLKWLPLSVLASLSLLLFVANYVPGRFLLGWDNTVPELAFGLNLQRFIFGIWQEYRGLGTLDGMAHTANISYWLLVRLLAFLMPIDMVRYASTLLLHFLGGLGLYYLLAGDVLPLVIRAQKKTLDSFQGRIMTISLMGATLYMLNLMTIQMFVTPLELFSVHFAVLPWGVLMLRRYFAEPSTKHLWWLFIINFLGSAQAHVPTIFIPYAVAMAVFLGWSWLQDPKKYFKIAVSASLVLFCAHAFWGVPYIYSTISKSAEISNSKQNRLGTDGTFYRNLAWGHPQGVMSFGGFQLDYRDWSIPDQQFESIMKDWVELYKQPWYQVIAIALSACSLFGVVVAVVIMIRYRKWQLLPYVAVWFFGLSMIGTDIPVIKEVSAILRNASPLFYQIFRFTFTKFSILYVCFLSVMFAVFWTAVLCRSGAVVFWKIVTASVLSIFAVGLVLVSYPAVFGNFFYSALRVKLPESYSRMFSYLEQNLKTARLVTFPVHSLWGWTTGVNAWGHRGSGFIWQAVEQPLVDRSFDPWSKHNETMYLQMSTALYRMDFATLLKTFEKYHSSTIFYDTTVFHPGGYEENLFAKEIDSFLTQSGAAKLTNDFDGLQFYSVQTKEKDTKLYAPQSLYQLSNEYHTTYTTHDDAYQQYGEYMQKDSEGIRYPFSVLQSDEMYNQSFIEGDNIVFNFLPSEKRTLIFPDFKAKQEVITATLEMKKVASDATETALYFNIPSIQAGSDVIYESKAATVLRGKYDTQSQVVLLNDSFVEVSADRPAATLTLPTSGELNLQLFQEYSQEKRSEKDVQADGSCEQSSQNTRCSTFTVLTEKSEAGSSQLLTIRADVVDTKGELPNICIFHSSEKTLCLNRKVDVDPTEDPKVITLNTSAIDTKGGEYGVRLSWEQSLGTQPWKSVESKTYTRTDAAIVSTDQALNTFQSKLQQIKNTSQELTFAFPIRVFGISTFNTVKPRSFGLKNCSQPQLGSVEKKGENSRPEYIVSEKALGCETFFFPEIDHRQQYLYHLNGKVLSGVGSRVLLINPFTKHFDIDTATRTGNFDLWVPVHPSYTTQLASDTTFQLVFNMETYARELNHTTVTDSVFYPLPLAWLTSIREEPSNIKQEFATTIQSYKKLGTTFYLANVKTQGDQGILVLPQAFDKGWLAISLTKLSLYTDHITYNGWANAWLLSQGEEQVLLVFWPQLLVFGGYILLIACGTTLTLFWLHERRGQGQLKTHSEQSKHHLQPYSKKNLNRRDNLRKLFKNFR